MASFFFDSFSDRLIWYSPKLDDCQSRPFSANAAAKPPMVKRKSARLKRPPMETGLLQSSLKLKAIVI